MTAGRGSPLGEFGRIDRFLKPLAAGFPGALGLSDDAALLSVAADEQLVVTSDAMVAGVHFLSDDPPADIAAKLLRVNLSDLAAMGAGPLAYALTTVLPRDIGDDWLAAFAHGLAEDQARYGIALAGGDSVATAGPVVVSVTAFGRVPKGEAVRRGGARADDVVFVSGTVGDAALGLEIALGRLAAPASTATPLLARLRRPEPRVTLGPALRGLAGAMIDVSDGLVADLGHVARTSGLSAEIEAARVPLSTAAREAVAGSSERLAVALTGGDDYELLFTAPRDRAEAVRAAAAACGVAVTAIGRMTGGEAGVVRVLGADGRPLTLARTGWTHF